MRNHTRRRSSESFALLTGISVLIFNREDSVTAVSKVL